MFVGTLTNVVTVLIGSALGVVIGSRIPDRLRKTVLAALGLATAGIGVREVVGVDDFIPVLAALLIGAVLGELFRVEQGLDRLGEWLQEKAGAEGSMAGFVIASLVFCVGPLTIVGSIEDGLGQPDLLLVKAGLDGFAALAFAAVYGWPVALSAITVIVVQGGIALGAGALEGVFDDQMLAALGGAGGVLLLGIALRLLDLAEIRVANLLPAVFLAPVFAALAG